MTEKIEFARMGGPVFSGRTRGQINRDKYGLDELDLASKTVEVVIPSETYAVTSSFFLGLFGKSVQVLGGRDQFLEKYHINAPNRLREKIEFYIELAIREKSPVLAGPK